MRKFIFYFAIFAIFIVCIFISSSLFILKDTDIEEYKNILKRKTKLSSCKRLKRDPLLQKRENVQKDIFVVKDNQRLHFRIFAKNSNLNLKENQKHIEFIENLEDITCLIQDKISTTNKHSQQIRYLKAKKGIYQYPNNTFLTDNIEISFFDIEGKELPDDITLFTPYLDGFARDVSFSIYDKSPKLKANHFRAFFIPSKELQ